MRKTMYVTSIPRAGTWIMSINPLQKYHHIHQDLFENGIPHSIHWFIPKTNGHWGLYNPRQAALCQRGGILRCKAATEGRMPEISIGSN